MFELASTLDQPLALEQADIGERGRTAARMGRVGWPVPEYRPARGAPERLRHLVGYQDAAQREVAAGHALGEHDHRWAHVPSLDAEPGAEPPEAADHRVDHEQ